MHRLVPNEVSAAVLTGRPELLTPLRNAVGKNGLDAETATTLIDLVRDAILMAQTDSARHRVLIERVKSLRGNVKGALSAVDAVISEMTGGAPFDDE